MKRTSGLALADQVGRSRSRENSVLTNDQFRHLFFRGVLLDEVEEVEPDFLPRSGQ